MHTGTLSSLLSKISLTYVEQKWLYLQYQAINLTMTEYCNHLLTIYPHTTVQSLTSTNFFIKLLILRLNTFHFRPLQKGGEKELHKVES